MQEHKFQPAVPSGDVTKQEHYKEIVSGIQREIFQRARTDALKKAENEIEIKKIVNMPTTYTVCEAFYEERSIYSESVPHGFAVTNADRQQRAEEYDMWQVECPKPADNFKKMYNKIPIKESTYMTDCNPCNTSGWVSCRCGSGMVVCQSCGGAGGFNCRSCGGSGIVNCSGCGGLGYNIHTETRVDQDNIPYDVQVEVRCACCGGRGEVTCNGCGGDGWNTCGTCGGHGDVVCPECRGSRSVTCFSCGGRGHFLHSVNVDQNFDVETVLTIQHEELPDVAIYNGKSFHGVEPTERDTVLCEYNSEEPIVVIPVDKVLPKLFSEPLTLSSEMITLERERGKRGRARKHLCYRVRVCQREILHVEYMFQNITYYILLDVSTKKYFMNQNPYDNVAANLLGNMDLYSRKLKFKSYLREYNEYLAILDYYEGNCDANTAQYRARLNRACVIACVLVNLVIQMVRLPPSFGVQEYLWPDLLTMKFFSVVLSVAWSLKVAKAWRKVASNFGIITLLILAFLSGTGTVIICYLSALI